MLVTCGSCLGIELNASMNYELLNWANHEGRGGVFGGVWRCLEVCLEVCLKVPVGGDWWRGGVGGGAGGVVYSVCCVW